MRMVLAPPEAMMEMPPESPHPPPPGCIRTLVVDDSPLAVKTIARILASDPAFQIIGTASDGCEAIRCVNRLNPDLVLMDVNMPHMDGLQAMKRIKQITDPPCVVIVTSDDRPSTKTQAYAAGADGFLSKCRDIPGAVIPYLWSLFGRESAGREHRKSV